MRHNCAVKLNHSGTIYTQSYSVMINSTNDISADISMNGQKFAEASSFKYRGAVQECTCSAEICIRIVFAKAAMARLNRIWFNIYKYFDTSIVLYGSETWTLLAD